MGFLREKVGGGGKLWENSKSNNATATLGPGVQEISENLSHCLWVGWMAYTLSSVNHKNTSQTLVSVSLRMQKRADNTSEVISIIANMVNSIEKMVTLIIPKTQTLC